MLSRNFYVDDFLHSQPTEEQALHVLEEGIKRVRRYDLNLCKVQSNSELVRNAFPSNEPLPTVMELKSAESMDPDQENTSSLGLQWHMLEATFFFPTTYCRGSISLDL